MMLKKINNLSYLLLLKVILSVVVAQGAKEELVGPEYLLHAGNRAILEQDIKSGIPKEAWDKFIMGGNGNFDGLPDFRRGLYGVVTEDLAPISLYGLSQWEKGRENWVMIIKLKPECRQKKSVVTNYEIVLDETPVTDSFTKWLRLKEKTNSLHPEALSLCLEENLQKMWNVGNFYGLNLASESIKYKSKICGGVIQDFFTDSKAKLIIDPVNGDPYNLVSWAIRDRSCIESISGTPEDLFQGLILGKLNIDHTPVEIFGDSVKPGNRPWVSLILMIDIFGEAPSFLKANWKKIVHSFMTKTGMQFTDQLLENFSELPHRVKNFEFQVIGYQLMEQNLACAKKKRLTDLQKIYKNFADWYFARNNKLCITQNLNDPICHWGSVPVNDSNNDLRPDLMNWGHTSSVLSLLKNVKELCTQ
jgi:hypothetical protein